MQEASRTEKQKMLVVAAGNPCRVLQELSWER